METKQIHLFDDRYVFVSQDHEVCSILHSLGHVKVNPDNDTKWLIRKSWIDCPYKALFVLMGNGEYLEIWGITSNIPWDHLYAEKITQKQTRSWRAYCVCEGMLGYLPNNVTYFTNKKEARAYAKEVRASDIVVNNFSTKAARDQFMADNSDF